MHQDDFDCTLRTTVKTDHDAIYRLLSDCWTEMYSHRVPPDAVKQYLQEDHVGEYLSVYLDCTEVAVIDGKIVGVISHCCGFINGLFVERRYRGNRIGSALLANAVHDGACYLDVAAFNKKAKRFYERNDWQITSTFNENVLGTEFRMYSMSKTGTSTLVV
jgi:GNAT superfamily N-acetyltransferase